MIACNICKIQRLPNEISCTSNVIKFTGKIIEVQFETNLEMERFSDITGFI